MPEPDEFLEAAQKLELAQHARGFLTVYQPAALQLFDAIWDLLSVKPLHEIARARPQPMRGRADESQITVTVLAVLAAILRQERVRRLTKVSRSHLRALVKRYAAECGLSDEWAKRLTTYLVGNR